VLRAFAEIWVRLTIKIAMARSSVPRCSSYWAAGPSSPTWLMFAVLGNASSGGAAAPLLLPPLHAFIGRFLSSGATVNIIHNAVYFGNV
jgi:hypothetical protein